MRDFLAVKHATMIRSYNFPHDQSYGDEMSLTCRVETIGPPEATKEFI